MTDCTSPEGHEFRYISFGRGYGHTSAMMEGAKNYDGRVAIVAHTKQFANELARQCKDGIGIGLDETHRLLGGQLPILVDHHAIEVLLGERESAVVALKREIERLRDIFRAIQEIGYGDTEAVWRMIDDALLTGDETCPFCGESNCNIRHAEPSYVDRSLG